MAKDRRYKTIGDLIETKKLKHFSEMLDIVPAAVLTKDLGLHYYKFRKRIEDPGEFTINECIKLATLTGTDYLTIAQLIAADLKK